MGRPGPRTITRLPGASHAFARRASRSRPNRLPAMASSSLAGLAKIDPASFCGVPCRLGRLDGLARTAGRPKSRRSGASGHGSRDRGHNLEHFLHLDRGALALCSPLATGHLFGFRWICRGIMDGLPHLGHSILAPCVFASSNPLTVPNALETRLYYRRPHPHEGFRLNSPSRRHETGAYFGRS